MPHEPKVHYIAKRDYYMCRVGGKQHYLGKKRHPAYQKFHALMAQHHPQTGAPLAVTNAIDAWTVEHGGEWEKQRLGGWRTFAGDVCLGELDRKSLNRYAKHLIGRGLSPWTIRHNIRLAHAVCRWCHDQEWIDRVPDKPKLPKPQQNPKDVPQDTLDDVLANLSGCSESIVLFILATGARPKEARLLHWDEVDLGRGVCVIPAHKTAKRTGRPRTIYLTEHAKEILEARSSRTGYVFLSRLGKPYTRHGLRSVLRRRGLSGAYCLRHTFAQHALEQTSIEDVAKLLGHADLSTVQVYAQVRDQRARRVAQGLRPPSKRQSVLSSPSSAGASAAGPSSPPGNPKPNPRKHARATGG